MMHFPRKLPNWQDILKNAWSCRFWIAASVCQVGEIVLALGAEFAPLWLRLVLQLLSLGFSLAGLYARGLIQKNWSSENGREPSP